jgi:hypothetical protein
MEDQHQSYYQEYRNYWKWKVEKQQKQGNDRQEGSDVNDDEREQGKIERIWSTLY